MEKIKVQKATDISKISTNMLDNYKNDLFLSSCKYDGNQIFIKNDNGILHFYNSSSNEFLVNDVSVWIDDVSNFTLVCEIFTNCGTLGERFNINNLIKKAVENLKNEVDGGIDIYNENISIKVFDIILDNKNSLDRYTILSRFVKLMPSFISPVDIKIIDIDNAILNSRELFKNNFEGIMLIKKDELYRVGKKVNYAIKIKEHKTADLFCFDVITKNDKISFLLLKDSQNRIVKLNSGLTHNDKMQSDNYFLNKVIEINYDFIKDTYINANILFIREDKNISDID